MDENVQPLWEHQRKGVELAVRNPIGFAFLFEQGTGKSRTAIETLRAKFSERGHLLPTIIFCPQIVISNWRDEWGKYSRVPESRVVSLVGPGKKRLEKFAECTAKSREWIFVTNYESLLMADLFSAMSLWCPQVLVFDEAHKCKTPGTKRSKAAAKLANPKGTDKPYTYILTGTPILNTPMDIFQQYLIMDGGLTFGSNFWLFRAKYFKDRNAHMPKDKKYPLWEVMTIQKDGIDGLREINEKIFKRGMRVEKKDCLDLPPEVSVIIKVEMSPTQKRLYVEMKKDFITFYKSKACTAQLAITKALRLMQITSGIVSVTDETHEEKEVIVEVLDDTPKLAAVKELLEEITESGGKVLLWAVWQKNYEQLAEVCKALSLDYVEIHGGISEKQKNENVARFKSDPNCRVFIGHPGSGGIGINLTVAAYSIFYSRTFSLEHYLQARARNHRGGSKEAGHENITHYDLVCEGTIEELAIQKLANKIEVSDKILNELVDELEKQ
jgi:SNF2 family DNA or RNA helicase